jgi:hypothetical protein
MNFKLQTVGTASNLAKMWTSTEYSSRLLHQPAQLHYTPLQVRTYLRCNESLRMCNTTGRGNLPGCSFVDSHLMPVGSSEVVRWSRFSGRSLMNLDIKDIPCHLKFLQWCNSQDCRQTVIIIKQDPAISVSVPCKRQLINVKTLLPAYPVTQMSKFSLIFNFQRAYATINIHDIHLYFWASPYLGHSHAEKFLSYSLSLNQTAPCWF